MNCSSSTAPRSSNNAIAACASTARSRPLDPAARQLQAMAPPDLLRTLNQALAALPDGALVVAHSGGMDSSVLLHALADLPAARARGLRALHVDHGLHAD